MPSPFPGMNPYLEQADAWHDFRLYDAARYATYLYDNEPQPPLVGEDLAWARQFLPRTVV